MDVSPDWIVNHLRLASRLATTVEAYSIRQHQDPLEVLAACGTAEWNLFARMSGVADKDRNYQPSESTRVMVRELVLDHRRKPCGACGLRQASRVEAKEAREGDEVCTNCWTLQFASAGTAIAAPAPEPLPANVTPIRRVGVVGKLGPWSERANAKPSTTNETKE